MSDELRQDIAGAIYDATGLRGEAWATASDVADEYVLADAVLAVVQPLVDERDRLKDEAVHYIAQRLALDEVAKHADALRARVDELQTERDDLDQELDAERITKPTLARLRHADEVRIACVHWDATAEPGDAEEALTAALEAHQSAIVTMDDAGPEFDAQYAARIALDLVRSWGASTSNALSNAALPADWRQRLGECESSGAAVDLVESWLGTVEAAPPHGPDAAPAVIPTFEMVAWCEIHDADARSCACPEGAYEEGHWDCATAGGVCIERHVGVSGTGTEAPPLADVPEAPMQITVTSGGDGGPGMRDINAAFAQHVPEDGAEDDRDTVVDVLTDADEDLHNECGGDGALMNRNYLEYLADRLLARYDICERGEKAAELVVTRAQIEAAARRIGVFSGREFQRHLDVPLAYQMFTDAGFSVEDGDLS